MSQSVIQPRPSIPPFPKRLFRDQVEFASLLWAGYAAFALVLILAVAYFRDIEISGWDVAIEVVPWYALFIGVHLGWTLLPLHVSHGATRREFMWQAVMFAAAFSAVLTLMLTVTFLAEAGLYRLADWPQEVQDDRLYSSAMQLHLVFLQHLLLIALWHASGFFIASAWYRQDWLGGVALTAAIVFAGISGISLSSDWGPFGEVYEWMTGAESIAAPAGVVAHLVLIAVVIGLTWLVVRDVPLRNKTA